MAPVCSGEPKRSTGQHLPAMSTVTRLQRAVGAKACEVKLFQHFHCSACFFVFFLVCVCSLIMFSDMDPLSLFCSINESAQHLIFGNYFENSICLYVHLFWIDVDLLVSPPQFKTSTIEQYYKLINLHVVK